MFIVCFLILTKCVFSQNTILAGFKLGASSYFGEVNQDKLFYNPNSSYGLLLKFVFNDRFSTRIEANKTSILIKDSDSKNNYQRIRDHRMKSNLMDYSFMLEYNFFSFAIPARDRGLKTSPSTLYLATGATYCFSSDSKNGFALPIAVGYKFNFMKTMGLHIEWNFKKMFHDGLDNISDGLNLGSKSPLFNNDWYHTFEVGINFKVWDDNRCFPYDIVPRLKKENGVYNDYE